MRFPNAAKGIKKIFTSEILSLISVIATGVAAILFVVFAANADVDNQAKVDISAGAAASGIGTVVFVAIAGVLAFIALILMIVGVVQTAKDEDSFKMIIYLTIVALIVSIVSGIFYGNQVLYNISTAVSSVISLLCTVLVIIGIGNLAQQLNNEEIMVKCGNLLRVIIWIGILSIILRIVSLLIPSVVTAVIVIALIVASVVLSIVQYILYLSLLSKAKRMLAEN